MDTLFDTEDTGISFPEICAQLGIRETTNWADRFGQAIGEQCSNLGVRTLSLFTGAGGLDIGFHDVGFDVVQMVEIDARFCQSLHANQRTGYFDKSTEITVASVNDVDRSIPLVTTDIDLVIGGPPCQPFSAAGRRANGTPGTDREDGQLFNEYIRLLQVCDPRAFVFENVYGITGSQGGEAWREISAAFEQAGYTISFRVLDSADYGVPQHRERMFIVGTKGESFKFPLPTHGPDSIGSHPHFCAKRSLEGLRIDSANPDLEIGGKYGELMPEIPPGLNYSFFTKKMGHPKAIFAWRSKFSDFLYKADPDRPVRTIKAQSGKYTGPFHWNSRRFESAELKRLQSFPDRYIIEGGRSVVSKQVGNSVPPQMARMVALSVADQLFNHEVPFQLEYLRDDQKLTFRSQKRKLSTEYFEKGRKAISSLRNIESKLVITDLPKKARIANNFEITFGAEGRADVAQRIENGELQIFAGRNLKENHSVQICLEPVTGLRWNFEIDRITISLSDRYRQSFLVGWKLLETILQSNQAKDSLVQLFGYYAYPPQVAVQLTHNKPLNRFWKSLKAITEGIGTREVMHKRDLAEAIECEQTQLLEILEKLKWYGFEIRNTNTNPTIPKNYFLVPYSFPTLTSVSVQRTKSLTNEVSA